jgi:hypothetical protein
VVPIATDTRAYVPIVCRLVWSPHGRRWEHSSNAMCDDWVVIAEAHAGCDDGNRHYSIRLPVHHRRGIAHDRPAAILDRDVQWCAD